MSLFMGFEMQGLTESLARVIEMVAEQGLYVSTVGMGFIAAILIIRYE